MVEITFTTSPYNLHLLEEIKKDTDYILSLTKKNDKRTTEQNSYMWSIIHEIAEKRNGRANTENEWDVYLEALESSGAKYEIITCIPQAEELLRKNYRAIKLLQSGIIKGKTYNAYKVFYGSSTMDKQQMAKLIEEVLNIASREGIDAELDIF